MRIAFLYSALSTYFLACLKSLSKHSDVQIMVVHWSTMKDAPFLFEDLNWIDRRFQKDDLPKHRLHKELKLFNPDAIYIAGWADKSYLSAIRKLKPRPVVISGMDNQWKGSLRQHLAALIAPLYLKPQIDIMWVAGERQRKLAKYFGYSTDVCWGGVYACDWNAFALNGQRSFRERNKAFLFAGRYAEEKGIEILAHAYQAYRNMVVEPWKLICVGTGFFHPAALYHESIDHKGFLQEVELSNLMCNCTAFVLPSIREPWGLVIQEAAAAGLPLICTETCGATVHLLQDNYNGYLIDASSVEQLCNAMLKMSTMDSIEWEEMSRRSFEMSKIFTPEGWAKKIRDNLPKHPKLLKQVKRVHPEGEKYHTI